MKGDGLYRRGEMWWMTWVTPDGKRHQASTGKHYHDEAKDVRNRVMGDVSNGRPVAAPGKLTFADLCGLIRSDYGAKRRKSIGTLEKTLKLLVRFFGTRRASAICSSDADAFRLWARAQRTKRLTQKGYAEATINQAVAALKHMLRLAVKDGKLAAAPVIEIPDPRNARQNFYTDRQVQAVWEALPEDLRPVWTFLYLTGWRINEALSLAWKQVDWRAGCFRLLDSKNGDAREVSFREYAQLKALLERQLANGEPVSSSWVFHRAGKRIAYTRWNDARRAAVVAAGVPDGWTHDMRRVAVRNMERAGVPRSVAMSITGHRTESMYRRYAIAEARAQDEAGVKLTKALQVTIE